MSQKPRLLITRKLPDAVEERAMRDYDATLNPDDAQIAPDELVRRAEGMDAILCCSSEKLTAEVIPRLPETIKMVATYSAGFDHIDLDAARDRGLVISNTPGVLTDATADITMLCILGAARQAHEAATTLRTGNWERWEATTMLGIDLNGKRLGILGMGRIGQAVAQRARAFDMKIHYHNRRRLPGDKEMGATYHETAEAMLPEVDILSLNCPLSPETHHFMDSRRIAMMRDGAIVVNTSRGPVVDDAALIEALRSGKLRAAGLDVFEGEPQVNPAYFDLQNAFLLPHVGSATVETRNAMGFKCLDNLDAWFAGTDLPDRLV